jgi:L-threonylcarbamoyladenylate synthase
MPTAPVLSATDPTALDAARRVLGAGGLVALPTETVYGLAADATDADAVARIFAAKGRPGHDPLIVHVADVEHAAFFGDFGPSGSLARRLAQAFWPGPLTIVVPDHGMAAPGVTAGLAHIALRAPAHPFFRSLLASRELALAAPSANPFGYVSPTRAEHVVAQLGEAVDLIVDGGPCAIGVESTVVLPRAASIEVLRFGGVTVEALEALGAPVTVGTRVLERPLAPGQLARHYATHTPLRIVSAPAAHDVERAVLVALVGEARAGGYGAMVELAPGGDPAQAAHALFDTLRRLDSAGYARIDVLTCEERGLGRALMDRVRRAAQTHSTGAT